MSLPMVYGTLLTTIPSQVPYLNGELEASARWRDRMANTQDQLNVGLVWAGSQIHKNDRNRSLPLSALAPLREVAGVRFFSLQKGEAAQEAASLSKAMRMIDWTAELTDFADTAALIANLDLIMTVDTAVAHLAGAMGKPVWTLLPFVADWRWLSEREDSPWYPSMRLFRQTAPGDWTGVVARVADALRGWPKESAMSTCPAHALRI